MLLKSAKTQKMYSKYNTVFNIICPKFHAEKQVGKSGKIDSSWKSVHICLCLSAEVKVCVWMNYCFHANL